MTISHRTTLALALATLAATCAASIPAATAAAVGSTHYTQPDIELRGYDKVLIEEPTLTYDETSSHRAAATTQRIRSAALATLRTAVAEQFELVTEAGPGVIRLRAAITDVHAESKPRRFWQYTPIGLVKGRIDAAKGTDVALRAATIELELTDSLTGDALAAVVDTDDYGSWGDVVARLDRWVRHVIDDPSRWNADA